MGWVSIDHANRFGLLRHVRWFQNRHVKSATMATAATSFARAGKRGSPSTRDENHQIRRCGRPFGDEHCEEAVHDDAARRALALRVQVALIWRRACQGGWARWGAWRCISPKS